MFSKKIKAAFAAAVLWSTGAFAASYTVAPWPSDLYDLDHQYGYKWGIETPWGEHEKVVSASLNFRNIRDSMEGDNDLYVDLLDDAPHDVNWYWDNLAPGDLFDGQGVALVSYHNLPMSGQNLSYHFTQAQLDSLNTFSKDGLFGLAFDPDCHFLNDGICLEVTTQCVAVPLPPAVLSAAPLAGLAVLGIRRMRRTA